MEGPGLGSKGEAVESGSGCEEDPREQVENMRLSGSCMTEISGTGCSLLSFV